MLSKAKLFGFFQAFGKSLLPPVAVLAAVGIILGFTAALNNPRVADLLPFMQSEVVAYALLTIRGISFRIFGLIPALFSISIAYGLAKKEKQVAAMAGFIGYYIMMFSISVMVASDFINFPESDLATVFGHTTLNMGATGGIIAGLIAAKVHNRFYNLKLPNGISFFGGKRSVPVITFLVTMVVGQFLPFAWMPINAGINAVGQGIASLGIFGPFVYGTLEKLLLPFGLQHILINMFRFTALGGSWVNYAGEVFEGTLPIVNEMIRLGYDTTYMLPYTRWMSQGRIPIHLFGLTAAALAMYKTTAKERRSFVKPLLIAGIISTVLTGITEPIEFLFLFTAPKLFLFHSLMTGLGFFFMDILDVVIPNIQAGLIDVLVFGVLFEGSRWYRIFVPAVVFVPTYYFTFKWFLTKNKIVIAEGAETGAQTDMFGDAEEEDTSTQTKKMTKRAGLIIEGLGGIENIEYVTNCITRLRVDVKNMELINEELLKSTSPIAINKATATHIQVIYGAIVEQVAEEVKDAMEMQGEKTIEGAEFA